MCLYVCMLLYVCVLQNYQAWQTNEQCSVENHQIKRQHLSVADSTLFRTEFRVNRNQYRYSKSIYTNGKLAMLSDVVTIMSYYCFW